MTGRIILDDQTGWSKLFVDLNSYCRHSAFGLRDLDWQKLVVDWDFWIITSWQLYAVGATVVESTGLPVGRFYEVLSSRWDGGPISESFVWQHDALIISHPDRKDEIRLVHSALITVLRLVHVSPRIDGRAAMWRDLPTRAEADRTVLCQAPCWQGAVYGPAAPVCSHLSINERNAPTGTNRINYGRVSIALGCRAAVRFQQRSAAAAYCCWLMLFLSSRYITMNAARAAQTACGVSRW